MTTDTDTDGPPHPERDRAGALSLVNDAAVHRLRANGGPALVQRVLALHEAEIDRPVRLWAGSRAGGLPGASPSAKRVADDLGRPPTGDRPDARVREDR